MPPERTIERREFACNPQRVATQQGTGEMVVGEHPVDRAEGIGRRGGIAAAGADADAKKGDAKKAEPAKKADAKK